MAKTVERTLYVVRQVDVSVCRNDAQDMKCGGPATLGFDFHVDYEETPAKIRKFIEAELKKNGLPNMGIYVGREKLEKPKSSVWSRTRMAKCIKDTAPGMRP